MENLKSYPDGIEKFIKDLLENDKETNPDLSEKEILEKYIGALEGEEGLKNPNLTIEDRTEIEEKINKIREYIKNHLE